MRICAFVALTTLGTWTAIAAAQPRQMQNVNRVAPLVPTFKLSGATTGKSTIAAGADAVVYLGDDWDLALSPELKFASSDGAASLFSYNKNNGLAYNATPQVGLSATLIGLGIDSSHEETAGGTMPGLESHLAYEQCRRACQNPLDVAYEKSFCDKVDREKRLGALRDALQWCRGDPAGVESCSSLKEVLKQVREESLQCGSAKPPDPKRCLAIEFKAAEIALNSCEKSEKAAACVWVAERVKSPGVAEPRGDLIPKDYWCKVGRDRYRKDVDLPLREARGRFPVWTVSFGVAGGGAQYGFLQSDHATPPNLSSSKSVKWSSIAAASLTYVQQHGPTTFEVPVVLDSRYTASKDTAKWCTPKGNVARASPSTETDPAESCLELPIDGPANNVELRSAVLLGAVVKPDGELRASLGPTFAYRFSGTSKGSYRVGVQTPVYVNLASFPKTYTGDYKLLLRISPIFELVQNATASSPQGGITIQLLGARNLFPRALEWQ